jgi:hypothetical protein
MTTATKTPATKAAPKITADSIVKVALTQVTFPFRVKDLRFALSAFFEYNDHWPKSMKERAIKLERKSYDGNVCDKAISVVDKMTHADLTSLLCAWLTSQKDLDMSNLIRWLEDIGSEKPPTGFAESTLVREVLDKSIRFVEEEIAKEAEQEAQEKKENAKFAAEREQSALEAAASLLRKKGYSVTAPSVRPVKVAAKKRPAI